MTGQQLKNAILQLAIQGKLVPQCPDDEPASELLKRIRKEKEALVEAGKLKKKDLVTTPVSDEEKPFDIPESWEWVNIPSIGISQLGKTKNPHQTNGVNRPYLCSINVYWEGINLNQTKEMIFDEDEILRYTVKKGDLLICEGGDCGRAAIWDEDFPFLYQNALHRVRFFGDINVKYILYYLSFIKTSSRLDAFIKGETIKHLVKGSLDSIPIPLPPLAEQRRIVAKIEELLPLVEEYDGSKKELDALNQSLPEALKKSVLQQAIMGKLVPQDPKDEPASELLKRIREEKKKLVDCGKLKKKDLDTTPISDEEKPFDIPESWEWCRLGEFLRMISGTSYSKNDLTKSGIRILRGGNIQAFKLELSDDDVIIKDSYKDDEKNIKENDVIIVGSTGSFNAIGKPAIINKTYENTQIGAFLRILRPIDLSVWQYICMIFRSYYYREMLLINVKGTSINNIKSEYITDMPIPLPPLAEQHRIVEKLEEILSKIEELKEK